MTDDARYPNPLVNTLASSWICNGRYFSAETWTAEIVFKRKPEPFKKGDRVELDGGVPGGKLGRLKGVTGSWGWVVWDDMDDTDYPRTISLGRLARAED